MEGRCVTCGRGVATGAKVGIVAGGGGEPTTGAWAMEARQRVEAQIADYAEQGGKGTSAAAAAAAAAHALVW